MNPTTAAEPILSVLIPTYNYADTIVEAIRSVADQGVDGVEIVIADDGSTDHTSSILQPFVDSGAVRYFRQENSGPATARNLALAQARGRYLMFLDADDVLLPDCLERTIDFLLRHPDVGLFFTNYDIFDDQGVVSASGVDGWKIFRTIPHSALADDAWLFNQSLAPYIIRYGGFMHTSGLTVSREVVERVGPFRAGFSYAEDDEFYARVANSTRAGYVDRVLSRKRNHDRSIIHDPANALRNADQLVQLTELQLVDYAHDAELSEILRVKLRAARFSLCWGLIEAGQSERARNLLRRSLMGDSWHWPYWKLLLKSLLR